MPYFSCILPAQASRRPLICSMSSSVSLPHCSRRRPFSCFHWASAMSLFIVILLYQFESTSDKADFGPLLVTFSKCRFPDSGRYAETHLADVDRNFYKGSPTALENLQSAQPFPPVGGGQIQLRTQRDDPSRVDAGVAVIVVLLDVIKMHGVGNAGLLVEIPQVAVEVFIILDTTQVALEVPVIHRIKANQGGEKPPVGLGDLVAGQIALPAQPLFELVQHPEQIAKRFFIGLLGRGKAGPIDPVIDVGVDLVIQDIDFLA